MAPVPPVPPAATPLQRSRATTPQPDPALPVPATPSRRVTENGPQHASAPHSRAGHSTSGTSPLFVRTWATSKDSASKQSIDPQLKQELETHLVHVETDAFIRAVLYKDEKTMKEDSRRAKEYMESTEAQSHHEGQAGEDPTDSSPQPTTTSPTTRHSAGSAPGRRSPISGRPSGQKLQLPKRFRSESDMYTKYVAHLNSVSQFFRNKIEDVDHAWLPAQPPTFPTASPIAIPPLNRVFRDTHKEGRDFSRYKFGQGLLKPDLCLLIEGPKTPEESEDKSKDELEESGKPEDQPEESQESQDEPNESKKSKGQPKPHWKDVLVPFEFKKDKGADSPVRVQMAQYARSVMLEQFDRNFVITVLITGHECRVFRWDVVRACVTQPFPTHSALFIQVMGRLATMTPSELGYDTQFSNAGRVRSTEIEHIQTHLTIHLSKPRAFFDPNATSSTPESSENGPSLVVDLKNMLFESKGLLFNRATRVWRAVAVNDPLPEAECQWSKAKTYIVKQNWADDMRPNEGFIHSRAQEVDVVPNLVGMEERQFTSSFRARFQEEHFLDFLRPAKAKGSGKSALKTRSIPRSHASHTYDHASTGVGDKGVGDEDVASNLGAGDEKRPFERVLLRFVFDGVGRPL
ncbi:hypothetical protein FRC01_000528, partial [Tulasnella sp. 417]